MSPFKSGRERKLWFALIISWVLIFLILIGSVAYTSVSLIGVKNQMAQYDPSILSKIQAEVTYIRNHPASNGKDGQNGVNGIDGTNGTNGKNAVSSYIEKDTTILQQVPLQGIPGADGLPGKDGKTIELGHTTDNQIVWRYVGDRDWQSPTEIDSTYANTVAQ